MYQNGDKVKLKNGSIVTISNNLNSLEMTEAYETYENILVTPNMIQERLN